MSDHVISKNMEFTRLAISQPFLKIETSGMDKRIYKTMGRTFHYFWGHKYISGHVTGYKLFFDRKVPISLKRFLTDM